MTVDGDHRVETKIVGFWGVVELSDVRLGLPGLKSVSGKTFNSICSSKVTGGVLEFYGGRGHYRLMSLSGFSGIQVLKIPGCHPIVSVVKRTMVRPKRTWSKGTNPFDCRDCRPVGLSRSPYGYVIRVLWSGLDTRDELSVTYDGNRSLFRDTEPSLFLETSQRSRHLRVDE